jgi:hypothetical protein
MNNPRASGQGKRTLVTDDPGNLLLAFSVGVQLVAPTRWYFFVAVLASSPDVHPVDASLLAAT